MGMPYTPSFTGRYRFLSNFYERPLTYRDIEFPTAEHAYQAQKAVTERGFQAIRNAKDAKQAKRKGRRIVCREDWDIVKDDIMLEILRAKFRDPSMALRLLATRGTELVEHNYWHDNYWGSCDCGGFMCGDGENVLGKLLMQIREEIQDYIEEEKSDEYCS
jgi:ribA/ribD-fused uncharacterized protein